MLSPLLLFGLLSDEEIVEQLEQLEQLKRICKKVIGKTQATEQGEVRGRARGRGLWQQIWFGCQHHHLVDTPDLLGKHVQSVQIQKLFTWTTFHQTFLSDLALLTQWYLCWMIPGHWSDGLFVSPATHLIGLPLAPLAAFYLLGFSFVSVWAPPLCFMLLSYNCPTKRAAARCSYFVTICTTSRRCSYARHWTRGGWHHEVRYCFVLGPLRLLRQRNDSQK